MNTMMGVAWVRCLAVGLGVATAACGSTKRNQGEAPLPEATGGAATEPQPTAGAPPAIDDPGYLPLHQLTNEEYDNTVADLLGTTVLPDGPRRDHGGEFRNDSSMLARIDGAQAEFYLGAADELVTEVFATPELKRRVLVCEAPGAGDAACARTIFEAFGRRAWRRPLEAAELDELVGRYRSALSELEKDHEGAVAFVLRIMLTSIKFTYLVELDPDLQLAASEGRDLDGYELAARLSYALWGTAPDEQLSTLAESGDLVETEALLGEAARLLDDPRSEFFVRSYLTRYLRVDAERLQSLNFDASLFPQWSPELAQAMTQESFAFLARFVNGGYRWSELLTAPLAGGAAGLEGIYADDPRGVRVGFLSLPAFLAAMSPPTRVSAVNRGTLVVKDLFCEPLVPPANVDIQLPPVDPVPSNPREQLRQHSSSDACALCHEWIDPIGLALENFDALGRYRSEWPGGDLIDPSGVFVAGGEDIPAPAPRYPFANAQELMPLLAADARLARCTSRKLLGYLTRRSPRSVDEAFAERLGDEWSAGELRVLLERLLESDVFRRRKLPREHLP